MNEDLLKYEAYLRHVIMQTPGMHPEAKFFKRVKNDLLRAEVLCKDVGLKAATTQISLVNNRLQSSRNVPDCSALLTEIQNVRGMIWSNYWIRKFVQIEEDFAFYENNDALFGEAVRNAFPNAVPDIVEAGNCIAIDSGTAAVFHLMRAVEWGLRALCRKLGILRVPHNKGFISIDYATWEGMLQRLNPAVEQKINKFRPGKRKQEAQEFFYPLLRDVRGFKDAWRNHVMHTRKAYSQKDAVALAEYVKNFMGVLATKVKE